MGVKSNVTPSLETLNEKCKDTPSLQICYSFHCGSGAVMGIQWFTTLGPILWDFKNLTMEFKQDGKKVKLRGATVRRLKSIQPEQLMKLMQHTGELSMMQLIPVHTQINPQPNTLQLEDNIHPDIIHLLQEFSNLLKKSLNYHLLEKNLTIKSLSKTTPKP